MLTRASVAKRLKRSIATVRRMEGRELHPWTDDRGIHRFDSHEVEQLALAEHHQDQRDEFTAVADYAPQVTRHRQHVEQLELDLSAAQEALRIEAQRSADLATQNRELRTTAIDVLEFVEVVLGSATPYEVLHCLYDLRSQR